MRRRPPDRTPSHLPRSTYTTPLMLSVIGGDSGSARAAPDIGG
ncbi:hypothetical protein ACTMTF_39410 [Nonomuraea sp. ZG12]